MPPCRDRSGAFPHLTLTRLIHEVSIYAWKKATSLMLPPCHPSIPQASRRFLCLSYLIEFQIISRMNGIVRVRDEKVGLVIFQVLGGTVTIQTDNKF